MDSSEEAENWDDNSHEGFSMSGTVGDGEEDEAMEGDVAGVGAIWTLASLDSDCDVVSALTMVEATRLSVDAVSIASLLDSCGSCLVFASAA